MLRPIRILQAFFAAAAYIGLTHGIKADDCPDLCYPSIPCNVTAPSCTGPMAGCEDFRSGAVIYNDRFINGNEPRNDQGLYYDTGGSAPVDCYTTYGCTWTGTACVLDMMKFIQTFTQNRIPC